MWGVDYLLSFWHKSISLVLYCLLELWHKREEQTVKGLGGVIFLRENLFYELQLVKTDLV